MPGCRAKLDVSLPSTSGFNHSRINTSSSPISPTGRIAKRNAQLINELNSKGVKRKSTFSEAIVGTVLELESYNLNEKCSIIFKIIDSESNKISIEHLNILQKQIEDFIADNIDNQKRIHGEILYLNTGDYPTDNLSDRLMPLYSVRPKSLLEQKIAAVVAVENINDLGLNSSLEEDEENPSVVDIPQRFWNWSREYLRHITEEYVRNFKEKIVDRFNEDAIYKFVHYDLTLNSKSLISQRDLNFEKKCICFYSNGNAINENCNVATKCDKRFKRRLSKTNDDCPLLMKNPSIDSSNIEMRNSDVLLTHAVTCTMSHKSDFKILKLNGKKTYSNDFGVEKNDNKHKKFNNKVEESFDISFHYSSNNNTLSNNINGFHYNGAPSPSKIINNCKLTKNTNNVESSINILTNLRDLGTILSSYGSEKGIISSNFTLKNLFFENKKQALNFKSDKMEENGIDEVSLEIMKKQKELVQLSNITSPIINKIYEKIQSEYTLYETLRRLDYADDKLFELGLKYESVNFFTKEQRQECAQALIARDKALKFFYYRPFKESHLASSSKSILHSQNFSNNKINGDYTDEFNDNKCTYS